MKRSGKVMTCVMCTIVMLVLILDSKTAISGAKDGIGLCLQTVLPSLFPFFLLSILIQSTLTGRRIPVLEPIGRLCGIPAGSESLLLLGLIGGYPVGAQNITQAYCSGSLTKKDARRMLGFCSNAGPAFIFGMLSPLFQDKWAPWALWLIHISAAVLVGILLPGKSNTACHPKAQIGITVTGAMRAAVRISAEVCGWVILFRILIHILDRWVLWLVPAQARVTLLGILELSNGCIELSTVTDERLRFLLCAFLLGFGGSCVILQTSSISQELGLGRYIPGRILHSLISLFLAYFVQFCLFEHFNWAMYGMILCLLSILLIIHAVKRKKTVEKPRPMVYNS